MAINLSRSEAEQRLQSLVGKVITYTGSRGVVCGKVDRLAVEWDDGLQVIFQIAHRRYEADIRYFIENTIVNGSTHTADGRDIWRLLKDDR